MVEGGETPIFKQFFSGWRDEGEQVGMGKVFRQGALGMFSLALNSNSSKFYMPYSIKNYKTTELLRAITVFR